MIKRHEATATAETADVWARLAARIPRDEIQWRIDGKPTERDGGWYARQVAWADVPVVVRRLDSVVPGDWSFTAEVIGPCTTRDGEKGVAVKGRLSILGVVREDVGVDTDEKAALTDAIKRTARLFGIALELWEFPQSWVQVSDDGKYAKITGDSWEAHDRAVARRDGTPAPRSSNGNGARTKPAPRSAELPVLPAWPALANGTDRESSVGLAARMKQLIEAGNVPSEVQAAIKKDLVEHPGALDRMQAIVARLEEQYFRPAAEPSSAQGSGLDPENELNAPPAKKAARKESGDVPPCPKCGGKMWDNRIGKRNPKAPDFKCRDRDCDGVVWPPKKGKGAESPAAAAADPEKEEDDGLPF